MEYGYFDDEQKEYVITRPDTPAPWANYLGSPEYGAIISNNAGGYSFVKSGADGRLIKYNFDGSDRPGRYIYFRNEDSGEFWTASWQPAAADLNKAEYECRHGLGYTLMTCRHSGILAQTLYYVPLGADYEVWKVRLTNTGNSAVNLGIFGYAEFTNNKNYEEDQVNLQYSQYITSTAFKQNKIVQYIHNNLDAIPKGKAVDNKVTEKRFLGLAGSAVVGYCGDKNDFFGRYSDYSAPQSVVSGKMTDTDNYNEHSCGALKTECTIGAGETLSLCFVLGAGDEEKADGIINKYDADVEKTVNGELGELKDFWADRLAGFKVNSPDKEFNSMINIWNAYNCYMTFTWSRAASFVYCGLRNGYGYRDTVQDIQGIIHLSPDMAKEKIRFMLSAQVHHGGGLPLVKFTHDPGHENTPEDPEYVKETGHPAYRADDALWLFPTVYKYIAESGNTAFLDETVPYADRNEDTVYDHLKMAIDFSMRHLGIHGLPAGLHADWNDCLRLGANGESTFVAFQLYYALTIMKELSEFKKDVKYIGFLDYKKTQLERIIDRYCFDEDRYIRGYTEDGERIGRKDAKEANLWLNPQSWAVVSGLSKDAQADLILKNVYERLNTEFGAVLMDPPFHEHAFEGAFAVIYNQGTKENAGIFSQSQGWLILAEALMGHGNRAYEYYCENSPAKQNGDADRRVLEPYCYGQFTEGPASPHFGRSQVHWLTGTASTMMVGCVEGILGMRPDLGGLRISPSIPAEWDRLEIEKMFRGRKLHITILNPSGKETGWSSMTVDGKAMEGNYIPETELTEETFVEYVM